MKRKAQAATEYLLTYGWAFMAIIITVGALAYFGVVNPTSFIPDRCNFGSQMECVDFMLDTTGIHMYIQNNYGKNITITAIEGINDALVCQGTPSIDIPAGEKEEITCTVTPALTKGNKKQVPMIITFKRQDGTVFHNVTGEVYSVVQ
jgi:hypothetical protein